MFRLSIEYQVKGNSKDMRKMDALADKIAGRKSVSSGCFLPTMTRDLQYNFLSEKDRNEAAKRLKKEGFNIA